MADEENRPGVAKRLGQLALGGLKDTASSYFSNISSLKSDADTIKSQLIQDGKSVLDIFNRMKTGTKSPGKKIKDWFYSEGLTVGGFGDEDDEFNGGFQVDGANDANNGEDTARSLDANSMEDIAKKQTGEAYKIAGKQAEMSMANTAEIISVINNRSAEMIASINKINESVLGLSKTLNTMAGIMEETNKQNAKIIKITDNDGTLNLSGIFEASRESFKNDKLGGLDTIKTLLGMATPQQLAQMGFDKLFSHQFSALGDRSVKDIAEGINEGIGEAVQSGLMSLIKNDTFQKWFSIGDIRKGHDFQSDVSNTYNTKPAVFDGMTRMSIINIIPEYLKNIEAAITGGQPKSIDNKGHLTTRQENYFQNNTRDAIFQNSYAGMSGSTIGSLTKGLKKSSGISSFDAKTTQAMLNSLKAGYINIILNGATGISRNATAILSPKEITVTGDPKYVKTTLVAIDFATEIMVATHGYSKEFWKSQFITLIATLQTDDGKPSAELRAFANNVTKSVASEESSNLNFAKNSSHASQASVVSADLLKAATIDKINITLHGNTYQNSEQQPVIRTLNNDKPEVKPRSEKSNSGSDTEATITTHGGDSTLIDIHKLLGDKLTILSDISKIISDNVSGIFSLLKTGINVFPRIKHPYDPNSKRAYINDEGQLIVGKQTFSSSDVTSLSPTGPTGDDQTGDNSGDNSNPTNPIVPTVPLPLVNNPTPSATPAVTDSNGNPINIIDAALSSQQETQNGDTTTTTTAQQTPQTLSEKSKAKVTEAKDAFASVIDEIIGGSGIKDTTSYAVLSGLTGNSAILNSQGTENIKTQFKNGFDSGIDKIFGFVDKGEAQYNAQKEKLNNKVTDVNDSIMGSIFARMGEENSQKVVNKSLTNINTLVEQDTASAQSSGDAKAIQYAQEDQNTMQEIQSIINGGNGNYTEGNIKSVRTLNNQFHNKKMKTQVTRFVIPMMKEHSVESKARAEKEESSKPKSVIGGSIGRIIKYSAKIFKPITFILGAGIKILSGISKTIFKIGGAMIKSGAQDIYYGAKSVGQGLFGSKKEGKESIGLIRRATGLPKRINQAASILTNGKVGEGKILSGIESFIAKGFSKGVDIFGKGLFKLKDFTDGLSNLFVGKNGIFTKFANGLPGKLIGGIKNGFTKTLETNPFLRGFFFARKEKREAKNKAKADSLVKSAPQTKSEAELSSINTEMTKSSGFLGGLLDTTANIKTILEDINVKNDPEAKAKLDTEREKEKAKQAKEEAERQAKENAKAKAEEEKRIKRQKKRDANEKKANDRAEAKRKKKEEKYNKLSDVDKAKADQKQEKADRRKEKKAAEKGAKATKKAARRSAIKNSKIGRAVGVIKGKGSGLEDIGKVMGGMSSILGGIAKILLGAITQLSGFKALMDMISNVLTSSLTPLNKVFQKVIKALRPTMAVIKRTLRSVATVITNIASSVIDTLQPILEDIIGPIIEALGPVLTDLGDVIGKTVVPILNLLVGTLLAPLLVEVVGVISPILTTISGAIEIIMGIISGIFGAVQVAVGILKMDSSTTSKGWDMMKSGWDMASQGFKDIATGVTGTVGAIANMFSSDDEEEEATVAEKPRVKNKIDKTTPQGSILEGTIGNGDIPTINNVTNNIINNYNDTGQLGDINNIYGTSTSQLSYGGYLGMANHGCGPIALADAVSRRTGRNISATSLAGAMMKNGTYSASKGTSVAGYISASNALGAGVRAGGVTNSSLKMASPRNPITLIGSGSGFGTRSGNNHYVNVVGTNGKGISYVANPMSGRVEKRSTSDLISHSALGLYGSGDTASSAADGGFYYTFPDAVQDALNELKRLAGSLLSIFTGPSTEDSINAQIDAKKNEQSVKDTKKMLGAEKYAEYEEQARQLAYADYEKKNPQLDSQSDEEYEKKKEEYFQNNIMKYLGQTEVFKQAEKMGGDVYANIYNSGDKLVEDKDTFMNGVEDAEGDGSLYDTVSGGTGFYSPDGKSKMFDFSPIKNKETHILKGGIKASPIFDYFTASTGNVTESYGSSWYGRYEDPDDEGNGHSGSTHGGVDICWSGGSQGKELRAITEGTVTALGSSGDSMGNAVRWRDNSGYEHIYMHMLNPPKVRVGDKISAGQVLGQVGSTGHSTGPHLHYQIYTGSGWDNVNESISPFKYWRYKQGKKKKGTTLNGTELVGETNQDKVWTALVTPKSGGGLGYSREAAAAIMSNMERESGYEPTISGGESGSEVGSLYRSYKSGEITGDQFLNASGYVGDYYVNKGFGLCQWLGAGEDYLKYKLYHYSLDNNLDIGNIKTQTDFLDYSMRSAPESYYDRLIDAIDNSDDPVQIMDYFLRRYELGIGNAYEGNNFGNSAAAEQYTGCYDKSYGFLQNILEKYANTRIPSKVSQDLSDIGYSLYDQVNDTIGSGHVDNLGQVTINSAADAAYYDYHKYDSYDKNGKLVSNDAPESIIKNYLAHGYTLDESITSSISSSEPHKVATNNTYSKGTPVKLAKVGTRYGSSGQNSITKEQAVLKYYITDGPFSDQTYNITSMGYNSNKTLKNVPSSVFTEMTPKEYYKELYVNDPYVTDRIKYRAEADYDESYSDMGNMYNLIRKGLGSYSNIFRDRITNEAYNTEDLYFFNDHLYRGGYMPSEHPDKYVDYSVRKTMWNAISEKLKGNGDFDNSMDIESFVGSGDTDIPPINMDSAFWNEMGFGNSESGGTVNYNIVRTSDPDADKRINALMRATFEVKSKTIEEKLQKLIDIVSSMPSGGSDWSTSYTGQQTNTPSLFNERIPSQISKLALG